MIPNPSFAKSSKTLIDSMVSTHQPLGIIGAVLEKRGL